MYFVVHVRNGTLLYRAFALLRPRLPGFLLSSGETEDENIGSLATTKRLIRRIHTTIAQVV